MVAFKRSRTRKDSSAADPESIDSIVNQIEALGLPEPEDDPSAISKAYLGGADKVISLYSKIRELKEINRFSSLLYDKSATGKLSQTLSHLTDLVNRESARYHSWMGMLSAERSETISTRIEILKDAAWSLKTEILENLNKVDAFLSDTVEKPSENAVSAARQINAVFNSIDRLEVRGRDSAGISLLFVLDEQAYADFEKKITAKGLEEEFGSRSGPGLLTNKNITIRHSNAPGGKRQTAVALTYKVAAEIGCLGDNIAFLRSQLHGDGIFKSLLAIEHSYFTVSAHTRWASVGEINEANCHPVDARTNASTMIEDAGIIHANLNGDIDNYQDLKAAHIAAGIRYPEEITCDTKIIPVHVAFYLSRGHGIEEAFRLAVNDFEGSHAISMHTDLAPGKIFLALKGSGQAVFIGLGPDHYIPTSEVYGFAEETPYFLKMDGESARRDADGKTVTGQICIVDQNSEGMLSGISGMFYDGTPVEFTEQDIRQTSLTSRDIDRQDFDHYFLKEISESPASVRRTLENRWKLVDTDGRRYEVRLDETNVPEKLVDHIREGGIRRILFIGQGTAGVAATACADLMRHYVDDPEIKIESVKSSELSGFMLHEKDKRQMSDTLLIPISQSGTTTDTNRAVDMIKKKGAWSIAIVNRRDSDLTFKTDGVVYTSSGRDIEMSVASTKAFYSQIIAGAILGLYLAQTTEKRSRAFVSNEIRQMIRLPDIMERVLSMKEHIRASAQRLALKRTYWAAVGSGPNKAAADEIRIKLSELCYKTISSDFVEDKKHIDLSSEPLIIICAAGTRRSVIGDIVKDTAIFRSHKALPVVIADEHEYRFDAYAEDVFRLPQVSEHFAPIVNTLVGHMWGYYAALAINEGSKFLHDFREDLRRTIEVFSNRGMDIFEIALENSLREKILQFYYELRKRQSENRLPSTLAIQESTNLVLLLKYLSGRLPIADFELDFGVKGTAGNMFDRLFASLAEAINAMARPVDAIKHQAKTVTVGTSRLEEKAEGLLFDTVSKSGFSIEHLTINNILVLKNVQRIIEKINGHTLYKISGVNLLGEPTDETTIEVIDKQGTSAAMASRAETDKALKGTKKIIVRQGNVYLGRGRKDDRSILVIPLISGDPSMPNMVEHLLLFDVVFKKDADLQTKVKALGGKHEHIKNIVQENNITWQDALLDMVEMEDLFGRSAEKVAEKIITISSA
ncbi:MAG: SIS domain-containing protein [Desulfobacteraceae bacterium]|nr:SIS domain-containing protein [Desulfobacteraceae bacterium]